MSRSRSRSPAKRSRSGSPGRLEKLRAEARDHVDEHGIDDKAHRILQRMHPIDLQRVLSTPFPSDVRNKTGFFISTIRKVEKEAERGEGYSWDGRSWSEPKGAGGGRRGGDRGGGGRPRGRSQDSRSRGRRGGGGGRQERSRSRGGGGRRESGGGGGRRRAHRSTRVRSRRREPSYDYDADDSR